jgi:hypothetical protein
VRSSCHQHLLLQRTRTAFTSCRLHCTAQSNTARTSKPPHLSLAYRLSLLAAEGAAQLSARLRMQPDTVSISDQLTFRLSLCAIILFSRTRSLRVAHLYILRVLFTYYPLISAILVFTAACNSYFIHTSSHSRTINALTYLLNVIPLLFSCLFLAFTCVSTCSSQRQLNPEIISYYSHGR